MKQVTSHFFNKFESKNAVARIQSNNHLNFPIIEFKQVHGADIKIFETSEDLKNHQPDEEYDGGLLFTSGHLFVKTADCFPVQIYNNHPEEKKPWIAQLHCGWRSVQKDIIQRLFEKVKIIEHIQVKIGPGICEKCFEVGEDLITEFTPLLENHHLILENYFSPIKNKKKKYFLNLKKLIINLISDNKISQRNISISNYCTYCHSQAFNSYRYHASNERNINHIGLI